MKDQHSLFRWVNNSLIDEVNRVQFSIFFFLNVQGMPTTSSDLTHKENITLYVRLPQSLLIV